MYSVWSRGRIIGQTDLGFIYRENGQRCGWFFPNELGEIVMPAATGISPAMFACYERGDNLFKDPDFAAACNYEAALELELRGPDGNVIETEFIGIRDMEFVLSIPDPEDDWMYEIDKPDDPVAEDILDEDGEDWVPDFVSDEPWDEEEPQHPLYQIQIRLIDHDALG